MHCYMSNDTPLCCTFLYDLNLLILSNNKIFRKLLKEQTLTVLLTAILITGQDLAVIWVIVLKLYTRSFLFGNVQLFLKCLNPYYKMYDKVFVLRGIISCSHILFWFDLYWKLVFNLLNLFKVHEPTQVLISVCIVAKLRCLMKRISEHITQTYLILLFTVFS